MKPKEQQQKLNNDASQGVAAAFMLCILGLLFSMSAKLPLFLDQKLDLNTAISTFVLALAAAHLPIFFGIQPRPIFLKIADYLWMSLSVAGAYFGILAFIQSDLETTIEQKSQVALVSIGSIESRLTNVQSECIVRALSLMRAKYENGYSDADCAAADYLLTAIAVRQKSENFPLEWEAANKRFSRIVALPENKDILDNFEQKIDWPLIKMMARFDKNASEAFEAKGTLEAFQVLSFNRPKSWIYFLALIAAIRFAKTTYEIAALKPSGIGKISSGKPEKNSAS